MEKVKTVFVQLTERPARKVIIKRGIKATHYFEYLWSLLTSIKSISGEPVCMWLPERYRKPGTSEYVQGVEVPVDYDGIIPDGFDVIAEEDYEQAIEEVWEAEKKYNPSVIGYEWDQDNPRIQLEPIGSRGYQACVNEIDIGENYDNFT